MLTEGEDAPIVDSIITRAADSRLFKNGKSKASISRHLVTHCFLLLTVLVGPSLDYQLLKNDKRLFIKYETLALA